jgi:hypothetical protein
MHDSLPSPTNKRHASRQRNESGALEGTTADESMVQDLPHHVGCGIRLFLPVRHLSSYVLAYPFGKALCPMAPRGKLEDSVAKPNITEIRIPRDPKASCATTRRLLRYDVTFGDVKASQGRVKMGDCRWQAKLGSSQVRSRVTLIKQLPAMCSDPAPRSSSQRRRSYRTQWLLQAPYLVFEKRGCSLILLGRQLSKEPRPKRLSLLVLVPELEAIPARLRRRKVSSRHPRGRATCLGKSLAQLMIRGCQDRRTACAA